MSKKNPRPIPQFNTAIIETHCHLDYLAEEDLESVLQQARDVGGGAFRDHCSVAR